jgi:hypothetical protein
MSDRKKVLKFFSYSICLKISVALVPPKPKEFDKEYSTDFSVDAFGE